MSSGLTPTPLASPTPFASALLPSTCKDLVAERLKIEQLLDAWRGDPPEVSGMLTSGIRQILHEIHRDPFDPELNVKTLKRRCRIRDNNISSHFRYALGITIRDYIEHLRLDAVSNLLRHLDIAIFDIALSVGYQNPQTFYNAFRRGFGCTPSDYRRRLALQPQASDAVS